MTFNKAIKRLGGRSWHITGRPGWWHVSVDGLPHGVRANEGVAYWAFWEDNGTFSGGYLGGASAQEGIKEVARVALQLARVRDAMRRLGAA